MNPSADKSLAFFKTNREVRLEQLLRKFTALDDGDAEYWWAEDRRDLIVAALEELGLRNTDAAGQVKTVAGKADRATASRGEGLTATAAPSFEIDETPLTDANILTEIPGQRWVDSQGYPRERVLADFARHLEIENKMLHHHMRRLMSNDISADEYKAAQLAAAPQAGKPRTAPRIAEEHPEKPAVAAFSSPAMDYEALWQRAKEKAKHIMDLRYPPEERDSREHEEHGLAVKFYAEMTKPS